MRAHRVLAMFVFSGFLGLLVLHCEPTSASGAPTVQPASQAAENDSLEARFNRRFPQKAKVSDLIGLPVLDDNDVTLGYVQKVVRTPDDKIELIVSYSPWFGWFGRPVAVPIEAVAMLGRQIASLDMAPKDYEAAPTWSNGKDQALLGNDVIRVALTRR